MKPLLLFTLLFFGHQLQAACLIQDSSGQQAPLNKDPLNLLFQTANPCPINVQALKMLLQKAGLNSQPYLVANRGIHNPDLGSFSFLKRSRATVQVLAFQSGGGNFSSVILPTQIRASSFQIKNPLKGSF